MAGEPFPPQKGDPPSLASKGGSQPLMKVDPSYTKSGCDNLKVNTLFV